MICDFWQVQEHKSLWIYSWCINLKSPNNCVCKQSPLCLFACVYIPSVLLCVKYLCMHVLILPSRSRSLSGRARGPVSDQSPLRRKRLTGGCLSCGKTHQQAVSHSQNLSHALKITLSTARLDITLESSSLACLQEVWPTNILMRTDLIMVKEGLDWWIETRRVLQGVHQLLHCSIKSIFFKVKVNNEFEFLFWTELSL